MKSILLKGIIVAAFLGIIIVIAASLLLNSNSGAKAFDSIIEKQSTVNFENINTKGRTVRHTYGGAYDDYATLVCNEIEILQKGINLYVGLLNYVGSLNRNETNNLVNLHDAYIEYANEANAYLTNYINFYNSASTALSETAKKQIPGYSADFVQSYNKAVAQGNKFFKELVNLINKYGFKNNMLKDYTRAYLEILTVYSEYTTTFVNTRMEVRRTGAAEVSLYNTNIAAANFRKLYNNQTLYTSSNEIANNTVATFVKNFNVINFSKLITESNYTSSLSSADAAKATGVSTFLSSAFGLSMAIINAA